MKAANINIAVALDAVLQALVQRLHLTRRSEDGRNSLGYRRLLLQEFIQVTIDWNGNASPLDDRFHHDATDVDHGIGDHLLGRRRRISRAVHDGDAWDSLAVSHTSVKRGGRSGLVGRVRATAVFQARNFGSGMAVVSATVTGTARSVRHHGWVLEEWGELSVGGQIAAVSRSEGVLGNLADANGTSASWNWGEYEVAVWVDHAGTRAHGTHAIAVHVSSGEGHGLELAHHIADTGISGSDVTLLLERMGVGDGGTDRGAKGSASGGSGDTSGLNGVCGGRIRHGVWVIPTVSSWRNLSDDAYGDKRGHGRGARYT